MNQPKITIDQWAARNYSPPPHRNTLSRWIKNGNIYPPPQKNGRWYVAPNAQYIDPTESTSELVDRLKHGT